MKTLQEEFQDDIKKSTSADEIIIQIKTLNQIHDKWELLTRLKSMTPEIAALSQGDIAAVISYTKQCLQLKADDMKLLRIEIARHRRAGLIKKHHTELDLNEHGNVRPSDKNIISIFQTDPEINSCFAKNLFTNEIDINQHGSWYLQSLPVPRTLKNDDLNQLKIYLINKYNAEFTIKQVDEAVKTLSIINHYDPLIDYLDPLKWDGIPKLETWLIDYCGAIDNPYTRWVGQVMLVAAVARAYCPGIKYDHVVVLSGDQGTMKTTLIETLASERFFNSITLSDNDRDTIQKMQGTWIAELPEGMPLKRREQDDLKNFVTSKKNKERFAYEHIMETYQRRSIFIMTINPRSLGYLTDDTGNRRYLPIRINGQIKIPEVIKHRDQLFAEAKYLFRSGFSLYINNSNIEILSGLADEHAIAEMYDEWEIPIIQWLISAHTTQLPDRISCMTIWTECLKGLPANYAQQREGLRIGRILKKLGAEYKQKRIGGIIDKGYHINELIARLKDNSINNVIEQAQTAMNWEE